jgi:hypothetical protein
VYCKDANRRGDFGHASFDFPGYTFRGKLSFPAGILNFESSCGVCDG